MSSNVSISSMVCPRRFRLIAMFAGEAARKACAPPSISRRLTQRPECSPHLGGKERRLFPRSEMTAFVELVVANKYGIGPLCPASGGRVDFVGEDAHGDRDRDTPDVEEASSRRNLRGVPVETRRGDPGVRQPVKRDVVEDVIPSKPLRLTIEDARDHTVTADVVIQHPRGEADR